VARDHRIGITHRSEVIDLIPLLNQVTIVNQLLQFFRTRGLVVSECGEQIKFLKAMTQDG